MHHVHQQHMQAPSQQINNPQNSQQKQREVAPFLKNLRKILDIESPEIIRWTPDGRAFEIHDMERMMSYVLPKYFKHRKYTSFQRQLNYFNFKKWTKSKAVVCTFSNDFFLRDQPDLAWRITRKKSIPTSASAAANSRAHTTTKMHHTSNNNSIKNTNKPVAVEYHHHRPTLAALPHISNEMPAFPHTAWKSEDISIIIPPPSTKYEGFDESIPSPTEMDMMLLEHDFEPRCSYRSNPLLYGVQDGSVIESLDWIDSLLPSLNAFAHGPEESLATYSDHLHHRNAQLFFPSADHGFVSASSL